MKLNRVLGMAAGMIALVAACEQGTDVTGIDSLDPAFTFDLSTDLKLEQVVVCKEGPRGAYNFTVTGNSNTTVPNASFTLAVPGDPGDDFPNCLIVATSGGGGSATVTEIEKASAPLQKVVTYQLKGDGSTTVTTIFPPVGGVVAAPVGNDNGWLLVFYNVRPGCTLTQGFWKTHNPSFQGGAPADPTWLLLGASAENTTFFLSGASWFTVFWTPPAGNPYYQLAHQYMAAKLNKLAGAGSSSTVDAAIATAEALFATYTPATAEALPKTSAVRTSFLDAATTLGAFNEGTAGGPDHCL
jgi:hypothetical protein